MFHKNFYKFGAEDNFSLGRQLGETFRAFSQNSWNMAAAKNDWLVKKERAVKFLKYNESYLSESLDEMRGYAEGADIPPIDMYTLLLEDETDEDYPERCTTIITNNGTLFAHNEDWDKESRDKICVIEKKIRELSIFELYYINTLGGNAVSVNSNGLIIGINSLVSKNTKVGISKNVISRWIQDTIDPNESMRILNTIPRGLGYSINMVGQSGKITNIEYDSEAIEKTSPTSPFIHTNHYLTGLKNGEANTDKNGTFTRYDIAKKMIRSKMTEDEIMAVMNDTSAGPQKSIMNERTIAKIVIDIENKLAKIWLLREEELGWVDYDLGAYFA